MLLLLFCTDVRTQVHTYVGTYLPGLPWLEEGNPEEFGEDGRREDRNRGHDERGLRNIARCAVGGRVLVACSRCLEHRSGPSRMDSLGTVLVRTYSCSLWLLPCPEYVHTYVTYVGAASVHAGDRSQQSGCQRRRSAACLARAWRYVLASRADAAGCTERGIECGHVRCSVDT